VREIGVGLLVDEMMPRLLAPQSLADEQIVAPLRGMIRDQPFDGVIGALGALRDRDDSTAALPTITVPVLVIVGEADAITPPGDAAAMAAQIPGARLVVIPRVGHLSPLENPDAVNQALAGLIDRASKTISPL
jgi:pimeloyl-ACP methyl ester carboxylesterase